MEEAKMREIVNAIKEGNSPADVADENDMDLIQLLINVSHADKEIFDAVSAEVKKSLLS